MRINATVTSTSTSNANVAYLPAELATSSTGQTSPQQLYSLSRNGTMCAEFFSDQPSGMLSPHLLLPKEGTDERGGACEVTSRALIGPECDDII
ncbi:hypothetical protein CDAR_496641 [Caerostris darwini]|uniref:Uncharacterized protein n=1 Tax=Caerostris darwini TaxID=1538125 RepID=A0AAV4MSL3_9ARAC|nr:hypothetical protein CDAR_496641 [Caerostris darwini]